MHTRPILRSRLDAVMCCCLGIALAGCTGRLEPTTRPSLSSISASDDAGSAQLVGLGDSSQPGFYPLRVGNRWVHRLTTTYRLIPSVGDAPPVETIEYNVHRRILAPVVLGDRIYLPEEIETVHPAGTWSYAVLYRQDAGGLYEFSAIRAAAPVAAPGAIERLIASRPAAEREALAAAASRLTERIAARVRWPGTVGPYEQTRLRYPLEPRTEWAINQGFIAPFIAEVVGPASLELGPGTLRGHRIRLRGGFLGPDDSSEVWYGPSGFLMSVAHVEAEATDPIGNLLGRWIIDQREALQELHLVGASFAELTPGFNRPAK